MNDTSDVGFPMLLSPRSTKLLDARPSLRWTSLAGATVYKITVRGDEGSWSATVPAKPDSETQEFVYPPPCAPGQSTGCAPALKAGQSYKLIIEAKGRSSEEEDLPGLGFTLLTDEEALKVKRRAEEINGLNLPDQLKARMLASLYANGGLYSDAIRVLGSLPAGQLSPEAVRLLGNLYLKLGLTRKAEALYLNLLKTDLMAQDTPAGKAITYQTLGEIYETIGNTKEAVRYYAEASRLYRALNDQESLRRTDSRLLDLRR